MVRYLLIILEEKIKSMRKYKFWSIYVPTATHWLYGDNEGKGGWLCIPVGKKYLPDWYPKNALIKKHKETILPPPSYWLKSEYEEIVYNQK